MAKNWRTWLPSYSSSVWARSPSYSNIQHIEEREFIWEYRWRGRERVEKHRAVYVFIWANVSEVHQPRPRTPKAQGQTFSNNNHTSTADAKTTPLYSSKVHVLAKLILSGTPYRERPFTHVLPVANHIRWRGKFSQHDMKQKTLWSMWKGGIH